MRLRGLEFRMRWVPTLVLALPIPVFLALGVWQLDRAGQKRDLAATLIARAELPVLALSGLVEDPASLRYRQVQVEGAFEAAEQVYIENRRRGGSNGFHVITPLRMAGSDVRVLVNRGWIPARPDGGLTAADVPQGPVVITGEVDVPSPPALDLAGGAGARAWGDRWPYLTVALYQARVAYPVQPLVVLQAAGDSGGFVREWPRPAADDIMHLGYAVQWFAFAVIALVIYLRLSLERPQGLGDAS
jgi:surfeit locus 1 family protein